MNEIKFIDLFGGIGGFHHGLAKASERFRCAWYCEKDKYAVQTYNKNFKENYRPTDITKVKAKDIPDFDMLCGGFPCQSFSIAGKRNGFQDTRGTMFFEICRLVKEKKPSILLLENVKGLLSADYGRCFATILLQLDELGYDVEWQVLNSKNFGVPQNRERVFIIGHLRGNGGQQVFPLRQNDERLVERSDETTNVRTLQGGGHSGGRHSGMTLIHNLFPRTGDPKIGGTGHLKKIDTCSYAHDTHNSQAIEVNNAIRSGGRGSLDRHQWDLVNSGNSIRRLTPVECERLQGYPDNWTEGVSDTQRYKQLGNAVTTNVIQAIGIEILQKGYK